MHKSLISRLHKKIIRRQITKRCIKQRQQIFFLLLLLLLIEIEKPKIKENKEKVPDYRRADFNKFRRSLASCDWNHLLNHDDINTAWQVFTNKLKQTVKSCIPLRNRHKIQNSKPKWWNSEIRYSLLAKKRAYQKYKTTKDINDKLEHDTIRRITKRLIKQINKMSNFM